MPASPSVAALNPAFALAGTDEPTPDGAFRGTLTPEAEFVLLSARTRLDGARRARWEKLLRGRWKGAPPNGASALDWSQVLRLARAHRVVELLGRQLSAHNWREVPATVQANLQSHLLHSTLHSHALKDELARVSHHLESAGVPVVSFKGITLGLSAYGNPVLRPRADLDILVARVDALRARDLLIEAGYAIEFDLSPTQTEIGLRVDSVFNFHRAPPASLQGVLHQGYAVELHWAITSPCLPFDLDFSTVAPRLNWISLPGIAPQAARVRALAPEDLLLILCVHGAKHLWERLIWLCDLAELLGATPDFNWDGLLRFARERGVQRMTALGLWLMHSVLGTPLPDAVHGWISTQPEALRLASRLRPTLLTLPLEDDPKAGQLAGHVLAADALLIQTIDSPVHRAGFVWHLATTPTLGERAALELPPKLDFLWCVLRPARALQKRLLSPKTLPPPAPTATSNA